MSGVVILANGRQRTAAGGSTIADLLASLELAAAHVVVEYNGEPLARERFGETALRSGDTIEIAQMVGGG